jgi:hypothetical protein
MVKLFCAIVGTAGSAFSVRVGEDDSVDDLKKAIKVEKANELKDVDADQLQLFLAKKDEGRGAWLESKDPDVISMRSGGIPEQVKTLLNVEMDPADEIADVFEGAPTKTTIHVLVKVLKGVGDDVALIGPSGAPPAAMHRHPERLKRWAAINEMIRQKNRDGNEKTSNQDTNRKRKNRDIDSSVPYSSLSWADFEPILPMEDFDLQAKAVPDKVVEQLHARLAQLRKLYGDIYTGKEAKRQLFIVAVIEAVCILLGDVTILVEEDVKGKNVRVHGRFEFVLKRGRKRISIVEAKRDDIPQGIAQNVAGLEALCDVEGLERTFGIVTNYLEWVFISDDDEKIRRIDETLKVRRSMPSKESLKEIIGMICGMLSEQ